MDKDEVQSFDSFGDLAAHLTTKARQRDLQVALRLAQNGRPVEAVDCLKGYDLSAEAPNAKTEYGRCYHEAAKAFLVEGDYATAIRYLKEAITLGFAPWYVNRRLDLVRGALGNDFKTRPDPAWLEQYTQSCETCGYDEPSPLDCARCAKHLRSPVKPVFYETIFDLYALGVYRWTGDPQSFNALSRMIRWMKKREGRASCEFLAYLLVEALRQDTDYLKQADVVISVPPDPVRTRERGFDNIAEMAVHMERYSLIPRADLVLLKTRATPDLRSLSASQRREALQGSIEVNGKRRHRIRDATVLLLDDVVTYGTTLDMCAEVLLSSGARKVLGATLARSESSLETDRWSGHQDAS